MTADEWRMLDKFSVVRMLGVNYRVDDQDTHPGANYGSVKLTAYRQSPTYHIYILPGDKRIAKMHYVGDWKRDRTRREIHA